MARVICCRVQRCVSLFFPRRKHDGHACAFFALMLRLAVVPCFLVVGSSTSRVLLLSLLSRFAFFVVLRSWLCFFSCCVLLFCRLLCLRLLGRWWLSVLFSRRHRFSAWLCSRIALSFVSARAKPRFFASACRFSRNGCFLRVPRFLASIRLKPLSFAVSTCLPRDGCFVGVARFSASNRLTPRSLAVSFCLPRDGCLSASHASCQASG